jgi:Protein of unknown function (DUF4058)
MPSPFPGMDPYLEKPESWPDLHQRLITYMAEALQSTLAPGYRARMDVRLYVVRPRRNVYPDVSIVREASAGYTVVQVAPPRPYVPSEVAEPYIVILPEEQHREPYLQIIDALNGEVITAIEVLSPANKTEGEGRRQYLRKQDEILNSDIHLVEIDLLSYGARVTPELRDAMGAQLDYRYVVCVSRAEDRSRYETYPITLKSSLPRFRVPLRAPDADVALDLQAVFNRAYDSAAYATEIKYTQPVPVALTAEEQTWVDQLLHNKIQASAA